MDRIRFSRDRTTEIIAVKDAPDDPPEIRSDRIATSSIFSLIRDAAAAVLRPGCNSATLET
jgi:hypothetical protein